MPIEIKETHELLGVITENKPFLPFLRTMFFGRDFTFDSKEVKFDKIQKGRKIAPFVAPNVPAKAAKRKGGVLETFEPAYVKRLDIVEPGQTFERMPGEAIGGSMSPQQRLDAESAKIAIEHDQAIALREEHMCAQVLTEGKVVVEGEDYESATVDYRRDADKTVTLVGANTWDTLSATSTQVRDDMEDYASRLVNPASAIIMGQLAWRLFVRFDWVQKERDINTRSTSSTLTTAPSNGQEMQYKGKIGDWDVYVYTGWYEDEQGTQKSFIQPSQFIMGNPQSAGVMAYGAIQEIESLMPMSRHMKQYVTDNPSALNQLTQSAPLPVMMNINSTLSGTVTE